MLDPATVYRRLHDAGVSLTAEDGRLLAAPASSLTEELRALIRENKPELLEFLRAAHSTTDDLLTAAMRACDLYGDGHPARQQMRADCLATPLHLRADLLAHFSRKDPK